MNFDWNDQDQVGETIWDEFNENDDHIVPFPKDTEENQVFGFEDSNKKQKKDDANTSTISSGQSSSAKKEFIVCNLENKGLDMDTWPDLPSLNAELSNGELSLNKSFSPLANSALPLDGGPELFSNAREDKGSESFLDCGWDNIGDFDDLDRIFRNESMFGHDMVTNVDEFFSSSVDMIDSNEQPIPMPNIPFQLVEHSSEERKAENKTADNVESGEQAFHQTQHSNQLVENDDRKKKLLKTCKKAEERSKNNASQIINAPWPQNMYQNQQFPSQNVHTFAIPPSQTIPPSSLATPKSKIGSNQMENNSSTNQFMYSQYGYPAYLFQNFYNDPTNISNVSNVVPEVQSKSSCMTPQEKIEKLRRRQQAQAMLAIQQQEQQFGHQRNGTGIMVSQENYQMNKGKDIIKSDVGVEGNENKLQPSGSYRISSLTEDGSLEKDIYNQLLDAMRKLDTKVRLCIRDSLFRLSRSSMERQSASDRNSTNKNSRDEHEVSVNVDTNRRKSHPRIPDVETYTNPIDRTVAHLLFHRPLESSKKSMNDEMPLHNPVSRNHHGSFI